MTMTRCGKLDHMFDSPALGPWLKVRLYTVAVVSLLTYAYGCESWNLTDDVMHKLNGANANSQMLSRITGNDVRTEARQVGYVQLRQRQTHTGSSLALAGWVKC